MKVFYFGPWGRPGHYVWTPSGNVARPEQAGPWSGGELDGSPIDWRRNITGRGVVPVDAEERQGIWRLTLRDGWTAIGAWDRTCDSRGGSKAVFVAEGEHTEDEMRLLAAEWFPAVWARITGAAREPIAP